MKNLKEFVALWPQGVTVISSIANDEYDLATMSEDLKWQAADHNWFINNRIEISHKGEVFREASNMHHCLHSNYWRRIKEGSYVAFAIDHNGEHFTLGCKFNGDFCMYDQAHTIYNGSVSHANMAWINDFIHDLDMFLSKQRNAVDFDWNRFIQDYDLPY